MDLGSLQSEGQHLGYEELRLEELPLSNPPGGDVNSTWAVTWDFDLTIAISQPSSTSQNISLGGNRSALRLIYEAATMTDGQSSTKWVHIELHAFIILTAHFKRDVKPIPMLPLAMTIAILINNTTSHASSSSSNSMGIPSARCTGENINMLQNRSSFYPL